MTQLSLESPNARELIGLLSAVLDLPDGASLAYSALTGVLHADPPIEEPIKTFTTVDEIKQRIRLSHETLYEIFQDEDVEYPVLRRWYKDTFELLDGDVTRLKGNSEYRWHTNFNNAVRSCDDVIQPVRRNRYRIVAPSCR